MNYMEDDSARVEWRVGDFLFGKTLCLHSEYLYMATESAVPNELTSGPLMAGSMAPSEPETHVTLSAPLAVDQDVEPLQEDALTERIIGKASVPSSCTRQKDTAVHCCGDPPLARSPLPPEPVEPGSRKAVLPRCGLRVSVVGCGRMGCMMAGEIARRGCEVTLYDATDFSRQRAMQTMRAFLYEYVERGYLLTADVEEVVSRCALVEELADAVGAHMVIEAVPEDLDIKQQLLKQIAKAYEQLSPPASSPLLFCSNTISLYISDIAVGAPAAFRSRVIGVRFLYPVWFIDEVELSPNSDCSSSAGTASEATALLRRMCLTPHLYNGHQPRRLTNAQAEAYALAQQRRVGQGAAAGKHTRREASAAEGSEKCSICMDAPRDTLTLPCGHVAACEACLEQ